MFELIFDKKFKKRYDKLDKSIQIQIKNKLLKLKVNPELGKHLLYLDLWSLRINKYRIIYKIKNDSLLIFILTLEHRKSVYENL